MITPSEPGHGYRAVIRSRARDWDRTVAPIHSFGGEPLLDATLPLCRLAGNRPFHLTLDLDLADPRLADLGVTSVSRLAILASYHCEFEPGVPLFVRHPGGGRRLEVVSEPGGRCVEGMVPVLPQLPVELEEISEAEAGVELVDEYPEPHEPLHQVGGRPVWVTRPLEPPTCPVSGEPMRFVAAVDSQRRFPLKDAETQLLFGNHGMLYVYWSDGPAISAALVQAP